MLAFQCKRMKTVIYLFLLVRFSAPDSFNCTEHKMNAVYSATRCCAVTKPEKDHTFTKCHEKYANMSDKPISELKAPERIAINICAHECSLVTKRFIRRKYRNEFDTDVIEDYFQKKYMDAFSATFLTDTFRKCIQFDTVGDVHIKFPDVSFIPKKCDPLAARIMMCVRTKAMQNCPQSLFDNSTNCENSRAYFRQCVGSIEKVVRNL